MIEIQECIYADKHDGGAVMVQWIGQYTWSYNVCSLGISPSEMA